MKALLSFFLVTLLAALVVSCSRPRSLRETGNGAPVEQETPTEIGNGGDFVRLLFEQGRLHAIEVLNRIEFDSIPDVVREVVPDEELKWLFANRAMLSKDLRHSRHVWFDRVKKNSCRHQTCACTGSTPESEIRFSFEMCVTKYQQNNRAEAGQVLVHESIHHFFGEDEDRADRMAAAVYAIYRNMGASDHKRWVQWEKSPFGPMPSNHSAWDGREWVVWDDLSIGYYNPFTRRWRNQVIPDSCHQPFVSVSAIAGPWLAALRTTATWVDGKLIRYIRGVNDTSTTPYEGRVFDTKTGACYPFFVPHFPKGTGLNTKLVVAGDKLIIYDPTFGLGQIYDSKTRAWREMSSVNAPILPVQTDLVWTGNRLFVLGGPSVNVDQFFGRFTLKLSAPASGALYDPQTDSWETISPIGAPTARQHASIFATKERVFIFGGETGSVQSALGVYSPIAQGAIYDIAEKRWTPVSMKGDPPPEEALTRLQHTPFAGAWVGSQVVLVGGGVWMYDANRRVWKSNEPILHPPWNPKTMSGTWTGLEFFLWNGSGGFSLQTAD